MTKKRSYTLHLCKDYVTEFENTFTENARREIDAGRITTIEGELLGDRSRLYVFRNSNIRPKWMDDVSAGFNIRERILNSSSSAVVFFEQDERIFAATFSYAHLYLDDSHLESDFGLRVAINSLDDDKLRGIERSNLSDALRGVSQSPTQRNLRSFGIDEALDLIRKVSGRSKRNDFVEAITGAQSLRLTNEMQLTDLPDIASTALRYFFSDEYKNTEFQILDVIYPENDRVKRAELDELMLASIKAERSEFELGLPMVSDTDTISYKFVGTGMRKGFPDLTMSDYTDELGNRLAEITVEDLKTKHKIVAEYSDTNIKKPWSIHRAIVGSLSSGGKRYAINDGMWYQIADAFKDSVDQEFERLVKQFDQRPLVFVKTISEDGKKTTYETELEYNVRTAYFRNWLLMDQKLVSVPEIYRSHIEICDLLDIENRTLIHVKKSSRSSTLSHFFKQGANSARLLKQYPAYWDAFIQKVREEHGGGNADTLIAAREGGDKWTVEFHIADKQKRRGGFTIPFFSRISLREETRQLNAMGFDVAIKFIEMN